jgi:hypothetical protein
MRLILSVMTAACLLVTWTGCAGTGKSGTRGLAGNEPVFPSGSDFTRLPVTVRLGINQATLVEYGSGAVQVRLKEVRDSRCPKGVNCVRAGEGLVTVAVGPVVDGKVSNERDLRLLTTEQKPQRHGPIGYRITALEPYPEKGQPPNYADYRAVIEVVR